MEKKVTKPSEFEIGWKIVIPDCKAINATNRQSSSKEIKGFSAFILGVDKKVEGENGYVTWSFICADCVIDITENTLTELDPACISDTEKEVVVTFNPKKVFIMSDDDPPEYVSYLIPNNYKEADDADVKYTAIAVRRTQENDAR